MLSSVHLALTVSYLSTFFSFKRVFDECDESLAAGLFVDLVHREKIDVVLGPPCSNSKFGSPVIFISVTYHTLALLSVVRLSLSYSVSQSKRRNMF